MKTSLQWHTPQKREFEKLWLSQSRWVGNANDVRAHELMLIGDAGANTIRALSLGVSLGNPLSVSPKLGVYNEAAFDIVDYTLFTAREYGTIG